MVIALVHWSLLIPSVSLGDGFVSFITIAVAAFLVMPSLPAVGVSLLTGSLIAGGHCQICCGVDELLFSQVMKA